MSEPSRAGPGGAGHVPAGAVRSLACPNCGAAIVLRGFAWTQTVACASCSTLLDARDPNLGILQRFEKASRVTPFIPLGTRGQWRGATYEVIGMQVVSITVDAIRYAWHEYLLFNPYHGFRYLTQYDGHWNDVVPVHGVPAKPGNGTNTVLHGGHTFRHFQTAQATTRYVIGEFPWEVRVGDEVRATDYVDPPRMLSAEETEGEVSWSYGEYVDGAEVWRAFQLPGDPPPVQGIFANQPSPYPSAGGMWKLFGLFAALLMVLTLARFVTAENGEVHRGQYAFNGGESSAFVTPSFRLAGGRANVVVDLRTSIDNTWMYVTYTLINEETGTAYDFGREVGYYHGYDSDGSWREGSQNDRARVGGVPDGRYFLRVATEMPPGSPTVVGQLRIRRGVPSFLPVLLILLALFVPPLVATIRLASFEGRRWAESDHAPQASLDSDDDE